MSINKTRPSYVPLHGTLGVNTVAPEDSLYIQASYPVGLPVPSADHNGKLNSNGQWVGYNDATLLRHEDWLDTSTTQALSTTRLTYVNGGNVLGAGAVVQTRGTYLIAGGRFTTDDAFLNPIGAGFTASPLVYPAAIVPGRLWLYVNEDGELRIESVGPAVADNPLAGEMTLDGLQLSAAGTVTDGSLAPTTLPLPSRRIDVVSPLLATGLVEIVGSGTMLDVEGGQVEGGDAAVMVDGGLGPAMILNSASPSDSTLFASNSGGGSAVGLLAASPTDGALLVLGQSGRGVNCTTTGAASGVYVAPSGAGRGIDVAHTGSGVGVYTDTSAGSNYALQAVGPAAGVSIYTSTVSGQALDAVASGVGNAVRATGGNNATSLAVRAESVHVDAFAIQALTAAAATANTAALLGSGRGDAAGVFANAIGTGYGLIVSADPSTPARAAMRMIPQDADPTTADQGALLFHSGRSATGKLRVRTTQWESVHSSARGYVFVWGATASGSTAGTTGNLSLAQISPEETGDVLVYATGGLEFNLDTGLCTVTLVDVTSGVTIATQLYAAPDTDGGGNNYATLSLRGTRTLPSAATRTFSVVIAANVGTITYSNVICSVQGVQ